MYFILLILLALLINFVNWKSSLDINPKIEDRDFELPGQVIINDCEL